MLNRTGVGVTSFFLGAALGLSSHFWDRDPLPLGKWDWAALGTWAAVVLALGGMLLNRHQHRMEEYRVRRDSALALTVQATTPGRVLPASPYFTSEITVTNHSSKPFLAVRIKDCTLQWPQDGDVWWVELENAETPVLSPGSALAATATLKQPVEQLRHADDTWIFGAIIEYVDPEGYRWRRWGNSEPVQVSTRPANANKDPKALAQILATEPPSSRRTKKSD